MKKIVIAGGSGFLGQVLARHFTEKRWKVVILSRSPAPPGQVGQSALWDGRTLGPWARELEEAEALINLCGKSVDCRYTAGNKAAILESRIQPTATLARAIKQTDRPPAVWINAASATIYRHSLDTPMDEETGEIGTGFSVDVCKTWEDRFFSPEIKNVRRVALRTSMVLGHGKNSVYPILARLARLGLGGKLGNGQQKLSWIHQTDFARAVEFLIGEDGMEGPINLTAPAPVSNDVFMRSLRNSLGIPFGIPHSKPLLEIAAWLMRTETELTLKSRFAIPAKLLKHRFVFDYPFIDEAFEALQAPGPARDKTRNKIRGHCLP